MQVNISFLSYFCLEISFGVYFLHFDSTVVVAVAVAAASAAVAMFVIL